MFTPIHRSLGLDPGDVTLSMIAQAVEHRTAESADLDWKQSVYDTRNPGWQDEAAKDIAAMANSGGGWIVFGVVEDGEANAASEISPVEWNADTQQRLLRASYARIGPPVLGLEFFPLPCDGGHVVLLRIPDSPDAPHFARKGADAFVAPRRNGPHTVFMSDREIERGFRERFQQAEDRERGLQVVFDRATQGLRPEQGVFIAMAALPIEMSHSASPMAEEQVHTFLRVPVPAGLVYHPGSHATRTWDGGRICKGLREWLIRTDDNSTYSYRKSLRDNGTVLAAYRLGALTDREEAASYYPVGQPNHCMSADIESAVIDFVATLRAYSAARQINAGYRVRLGLIGNNNEPIYVRTTESRSNYLLGPENSEPIHHFEMVTADLDPLAPVSALLPVLNQLARDVINQGGVKNLKVMAEPDDPAEG